MGDLQVNKVFNHKFVFSQEHVLLFAEASGDRNPVHLSDEYASNTIFKKKIIHGFLAGSVFSSFFGMIFPGEGSIYLSQNMKFLRPMFVDILYEAEITIKEINHDRKRITFETNVKDAEGEIKITGEAIIYNEKLFT